MHALSGILVIDKPIGLTSMTAVSIVRRKAGGLKTGHAGTLDPLATGVLVVALGTATRSIDRLMNTTKRYRTVIDLSAFTSTDDTEGAREEVAVAAPPDQADVRAALDRFTGTFEQRPPAFSAVKVEGRRSYKLARRGAVERPAARLVTVLAMELNAYRWPTVELEIHCHKGFYVRSLARDVGEALGTGGHCTMIRRTAVGPFSIQEARRLEDLPDRLEAADLISLESAMRRLGEPDRDAT